MLEAGVHQVEHAAQVDVDGIGERLGRQARRQRSDAGVGDHDVEVTELGNAPRRSPPTVPRGRARRRSR